MASFTSKSSGNGRKSKKKSYVHSSTTIFDLLAAFVVIYGLGNSDFILNHQWVALKHVFSHTRNYINNQWESVCATSEGKAGDRFLSELL